MKILLVSSGSGSRGGGELYLLYLGRALAARGHTVTLWAPAHPRMDELCAQFTAIGSVERSHYTNTYDHRLRSITSYFSAGTARRVAREWRAFQPDVIHINKQNLEDGLDLLRAATLSEIPSISTIHLSQSATYLKAVMAPLRDWVSRRALLQYRGPLVCVLEQRLQDLRNFLGRRENIHAVPNGVELYDLSQRETLRKTKRAELGIAPDTLLLAAVGRMVPQKRPLVFLETAARIHKRLPNTRFIWVGDGQLTTEWDDWVKQHGMGEVIRRIGWQRKVRDFLFAADAFLHTAEFEGLPLAILEAFSAALPCAITPNLLAEMPFLHAGNSIAIGDDDAWAGVLSDPHRMAALGANARHLAEAEFSHAMMAARTEALYRSAIDARC